MGWSIKKLTETAELPVTVEELKDHARIEHDADDALLNGYLRAATELVQEQMGRVLVSETYRLRLFQWPRGRRIRLPYPPLVSVDTFQYTKRGEGTATAVDSSIYSVLTDSEPGEIVLNPNMSWPTTELAADGIEVEFTAGYGARSNVPERVKQAIMLIVAHWYANREATIQGTISKEVELSFRSLLMADRVWWSGP